MRQNDGNTWAAAATVAMMALGVAAVSALGGCDAKPAAVPVRPDVTDVRRPAGRPVLAAYAPPLYDTSAVIPIAPQPVTVAPAAAADSPVRFADAPAPATVKPVVAVTATKTAARRTHTVRRGETLTAIARAAYGDGSQWRRVAAANPAAAGGSLRVGQLLVLP